MKLTFGGIHVLQTIKVETEDGTTELEFPSSMTREAIIHYLADIMKRKVTYSIHNDVYTIHSEEEKMKLADELKEISDVARQERHVKYVNTIREKAREAAEKGAGEVEVKLEADAYHCRHLIGHVLTDEDRLNVKTRYVTNAFTDDYFLVLVEWRYMSLHAPYHKDKE